MLPRAPLDPQVYREPFFSLRRPSRSVVSRFLAHLLVRLLIVSALPGQWQAVAALFPVSMLWPLVAPQERRYFYANDNPTRYVDPTGHCVESGIEIASIAVGAYSLKENVKAKNWWGVAGDVLGSAVDAVALAVPLVPGGVGLAIKGARAYKAARAVDAAVSVGQGTAGAIDSFAEGHGVRGAVQTGLTAAGVSGLRKLPGELAQDVSKASSNLSEAQKAARVAESPTADAAVPVPGARVESGTKPVADSAVPLPPTRQPAAAAGGSGGGRPVDDAPRTGSGGGRGSSDGGDPARGAPRSGPAPGDVDFVGPIQPGERPIVVGKVRRATRSFIECGVPQGVPGACITGQVGGKRRSTLRHAATGQVVRTLAHRPQAGSMAGCRRARAQLQALAVKDGSPTAAVVLERSSYVSPIDRLHLDPWLVGSGLPWPRLDNGQQERRGLGKLESSAVVV